jgi:uncharacterized protein YycO
MKELAHALYSERVQCENVEIPTESSKYVLYNEDTDVYYIRYGAAGAVKTSINSFTDNEDGTKTVEVNFLSSEDNTIRKTYIYTLVENDMSNTSEFPYAIKDVSIK